MHLLDPREPVFVVDLTDQTMDNCKRDFEPANEGASSPPPVAPAPRRLSTPEHDVRAVALVFDWQHDPVLLAVNATRDIEMLDALARLLRASLLTGQSVAHLATEFGDPAMQRMYFARRFPRFVYSGIPMPVRARLPKQLVSAMGSSRR
jgi:hypothetical protein